MNRFLQFISFLVFVFSSLISCKQESVTSHLKKPVYEQSMQYSQFLNPGVDYRSYPFYSINDSLTEEEITWQIHDFKQAGFGGFYLHSRLGLITEFLGDDWWKIMQAAVVAAQDSGLHAMFYDEDKWPSGYAGGIIPRMSEDYRAKCLVRYDKNTTLPEGCKTIKTDSLYNYVIYTAQFGYDIFNGTCYVDLFNPEVVQKFIDVSYQPYVDKYGSMIQDYSFAIFSDEPHIHARYYDRNTPNKGVLSYSPWLEKKFKALYGYNLRDKLDLLFEEKDNWREVRMQYYRAKALQFEESFTKQLSDFAAKNGIIYTGHYLGEEVQQKVRDRIGDAMLHYRNMQQPGMDRLGLSFDGATITAKSLSSAANQYGKRKRLSELFGISGQNMNFEDRKWIAGWHSILGINHFCPHLTLYSMKGARKRDYPPTFSYQQPYWHYNKKVEDYLGRIAYATTIGEYDPQILVIHPLESEFIKGNEDGEFTTGINEVLDVLQASHYDYDLGDEQIIADTAFLKDNRLKIGRMQYQHAILPDMISIRKTTADLLLQLHKKGGLIFTTGRFPSFVDGKKDVETLNALKAATINASIDQLAQTLIRNVAPNVQISGENGEMVWSQTRITDGGKLIQLYNTSHKFPITFHLKAEMPGENVVLWDPSLAQCFDITKEEEDNTCIITIEPSSSLWLTSGDLSDDAQTSGAYQTPVKEHKTVVTLDNLWQGKRLDPNAITLDFATYSIDHGKTFSQPEPVIGIFNRLSENGYYGNLTLRYSIEIKDNPSNCKFVLEQPEMYNSIKVNGKPYTFNTNGFFVDHTFKTSDISGQLKKGKNTIELQLNFEPIVAESPEPSKRYGTEIESIYLIGDFAVSGTLSSTYDTQKNNTGDFQKRPVHQYENFIISKENSTFKGNLAIEGYPFYSGSFSLSQKFNIKALKSDSKYYLELPNCEAIVSIIKINGKLANSLTWAPFRTDITPLLKNGENEVEITLVNSLRNLLGPHHHKGGELEKVGPRSFTGSGGFPDGRGERDWYNLRLENKPTAIWTDTYNFIPFGFVENVRITTN